MAIQVIKHDAIARELQDAGPVGIPLSQPTCMIKSARRLIDGKEHVDAGIWECSPGKFRREITHGEVMHVLAGECSFTPDDGGLAIDLKGGDTAFFPPNTTGVWDIRQGLRKVYVLL